MNTNENNYFQLFALAERFELDMQQLTDNYRALQRATHPDRFANASEKERRLSVQQAALVNDAFNTLKSPLLRATYLLSLRGVEVGAENNTAMDPMFLMEQMELREALADVGDDDQAVDKIGGILDDIAAKMQSLTKALENNFSAGTAAGLQEAAANVRKLQFFFKLQEEAESVEARFDH